MKMNRPFEIREINVPTKACIHNRTYRFSAPLKPITSTLLMKKCLGSSKSVPFKRSPSPIIKRKSGKTLECQSRPRVSFAPKIRVHRQRLVVAAEYMDNTRTWYKAKDYANFSRETKQTLDAVDRVRCDLSALNPDMYCIQGLESQLTRQQSVERKLHLTRSKRAILEHQQYQRYSGVSDPDSLRNVSQVFSEQSIKRAHMRAIIQHEILSPSR